KSGVQTSGIRKIKGEKTGAAVVIVEDESGENRILITPGANACISATAAAAAGTSLSVDSWPDIIVLQLEIPLETVLDVMRDAKERGIPILLNPAPALKLPEDIYRQLDHLIMNETEAVMLGEWDGGGKNGLFGNNNNNNNNNVQSLCDRFHEKGVRNVVITLGANGVHYSTHHEKGGNHVAAVKVAKVVDTTAAGDTFVGAYAVAVVNGIGVGGAVEWANKAAARTVEKEGAQDAIPWVDEVDGLPQGVRR
ncbi:MAG: hypothetical protein Q9224_007053, partial [Gallowayella concinna]